LIFGTIFAIFQKKQKLIAQGKKWVYSKRKIMATLKKNIDALTYENET